MRLVKLFLGAVFSVLLVLSLQFPVHAATPQRDSQAGTSDDRVLEVGETISGRVAVTSSAQSCLWVYYHLTQVETNKVKLRYGLEDPCRGHQVMVWNTRSDRFRGDGAAGAVKHREWKCYTCHKIWRNVYMFDPGGRQRFQMMTVYIGLTGSNHSNDVLLGENFYT